MNQSKAISISKEYSMIMKFVAFLGLTMVAPFLGNQLLTGTLVNALLVSSVFVFGIRGALLLALTPSLVSVTVGLLPSAMTPMIPFIITANVLLVAIVDRFRKSNYFSIGLFGASAKAGFLFLVSYIMFNIFLTGPGAKVASSMMGYMQLLTASLGVIVAYPIVRAFKR
jgi:hypothetical protein